MQIPQNFLKLIYMNVVLTFHLSLCLALIGLLPQMAEQNGYTDLGNYSILAIYIAQFCFDIFAPVYLKNKQFNLALTFQAFLVVPSFFASDYLVNCYKNDQSSWICNPVLLTPLSVVFAFMLGAGLGGYFVVQNYYISRCASSQTQEIMFSSAYILMGLSFMFNGFYADMMLKMVSRSNFFWISGLFEIGLSLLFLFVRTPDKKQTLIEDIAVNSANSEIQSKENETIKQNLMDMYNVFKDKTTYIYYPLYCMTGIIIGFEYGLLYQFINQALKDEGYDEQEVNRRTARVYLFVGIAQTLGAILIGILKKKLGSYINLVFYSNLLAVALFFSLVDSFISNYSFTIALGFFLGLSDISGQFNACITISEVYQDSMPIYGIYFCIQNLSISFMIIQATILENVHLGYNIIIVIITQIIVNMAMHSINRKKQE